jgi:site-specific recombinase XerD
VFFGVFFSVFLMKELEMKLYKRGSIYYAIDPVSNRRYSTGCTTKVEALKWKMDDHVPEPTDTLDLLFKRQLNEEYRDSNNLASVDASMRCVLTFFGPQKQLRDITQQNVASFKHWLTEQPTLKTPSTRNKKLLCLSHLLKVAKREWGLSNVPQVYVKLERVRNGRKFIYTDEQIQQILSYFKSGSNDFMHDLTLYLSQTGLRLGEALRLTAADIRPEAKMVDVWQTKADEPRGIPMTAPVQQLLTRRQDFSGETTFWVAKQWSKMREALKLTADAKLHSLRHTFATRLCEKGVDIQVVQRLLGHRNISTTMIYAKMTSKRLNEAMYLFEK